MLRSAVFVLALLPFAAFAVGTETPTETEVEETAPPEATETTMECDDGMVWDKETEACVEVESHLLNDNDRFAAAREFAYAGQYGAARNAALAMQLQGDGRAQTYLGFTARKLGDWDAAMAHYAMALDQNPDSFLARSYMGQGLLEQGDFAGAKAQLQEIRARGGAGTWAEFALAQSIVTGVTYSY
ncbi:tetratricopeptide repeat protein [Marinovum sp. 2_MG-2023]|uniref:tetratricopeptide repeat protein n=1 Tax=unclassified Marinovum TaxID=2647166 RepID=UPI0026E304C9|nr:MULTISPECIES: tetratricopeptide repeat protein [unclassified Marinovum]MDO6730472.1 tetratricopeptide repeat protein [Marinovum sp. 2_MG-2023]MDO6778452.1 tetratricopeptide repeat protein [Marinovum sp. 1_MG-2023]